MRLRRRPRSHRNNNSSYFTACKWCGERIHIREMPHGQWVAFGGSRLVHKCPESTEYDPISADSLHPQASFGQRNHSAQATKVSGSQSILFAEKRSHEILTSPKTAQGWPAWVWWLIVVGILFFMLKK